MTEPEDKAISLATKLSVIMGQLGHVEKKGRNQSQKYNFVRESDVVAALVPLLSAQHILLHTTVTSHSREPLYQTQSGLTMWITTVTVDGTFIDGDTGEVMPIATFVGTGADTGDKGVFKAMTGAEKYLLLKAFLISTGDDPEGDEKVDKEEAALSAADGPVRVSRGKQAGVQRGGKSSIITMTQVNSIARLARDAGLDADGVIAVVSKIVGGEPADGQSLREWMGTFTGDQAKEIQAALSVGQGDVETAVETGDKSSTNGTEDVDKEVVEAMPVV